MGVVGRVAHAKSSDPATPQKKIWNMHPQEMGIKKVAKCCKGLKNVANVEGLQSVANVVEL